jgi:HSP20 family protein
VEFPATNVWVSENSAVVTTEVPGIDPIALEISVVKDSLTLRGSRKAEELKEGEAYHRQERWNGQFTRTLELPFPVDADKVEARFAKGVLYISLPRAEADKPRKITVKPEQA